MRRRVESLLASDEPDELDFTEDIKDAKKRVSDQRWNIENYGAVSHESPTSGTPPYHNPPQKTLKDVIASNNTVSSEKRKSNFALSCNKTVHLSIAPRPKN